MHHRSERLARTKAATRALAVLLLLTPAAPVASGQDAADRVKCPSGRIQVAPEFSSSAPSVEIASVELADDKNGFFVRVKLRNLVDEAVIGYRFEVRGSDPNSSLGVSELVLLGDQTDAPKAAVGAREERVIDLEAGNFLPDDTLRLSAVLFASGRGEGDVRDVDRMRREATTLPVFVEATESDSPN